jgi:uncharacterized membrane protein
LTPPISPRDLQFPRQRLLLVLAAPLFCTAAFTLSWWRWWTYQYGTFDLAFYVQSLWLAVHGQAQVSLLDVPMLGNHAEPIVFLLTPLFALLPHPMLLVAVQVLALATMPFTGWRIARKLGLEGSTATALALLTLLTPATGFIAVHEFHPEAFAAPLLLLLAEARLSGRLGLFWLWFAAGVACKENIALLLAGWGFVHAWCDWRKERAWRWPEQGRWNLLPALAALAWLGLYAFWLSPRLNGGRVDYGNLYAHLGSSGGDIVRHFFTDPQRVLGALRESIFGGNLVWSLFLAFAFLPLLRARWLLIAAPIFLQHLLSSRPSEWSIDFHYAAPLVALLWIAAAEALVRFRLPPVAAFVPLAACLVLQCCIGPFRGVPADFRTMETVLWTREWKAGAVERIAADPAASVCAGLPYLSHLALRPKLYSLHFVLKGLKTLSAVRYDPTFDPDVVLIDYADDATFSSQARFYHPEGELLPLPSSDDLLNGFLARHEWTVETINSLALLSRGRRSAPVGAAAGGPQIDARSMLLGMGLVPGARADVFRLNLDWKFTAPRVRIPWVKLALNDGAHEYPILLGMCAPEIASGEISEHRSVTLPPEIPPGKYRVSAVFFSQIEALWHPLQSPVLADVPLGDVTWSGRRPAIRP